MRRLIILLLALVGISSAQTVSDAVKLTLPGYGSGARAIGMGNAFVAMSDDGLGIFYNPAGIALVKRFELGGGLKYSYIGNKTSFFDQKSDVNNTAVLLDNFSILLPVPTLKGSLVLGTSYNNVQDFTGRMDFSAFNPGNSSMIQNLNLDTEIPFDLYLTDTLYNCLLNGKLDQSGSRLQTGSTGIWNFSAAYEGAKNLFLGITVGIGSGSYENSFDYAENDYKGTYDNIELSPGDSFTKHFRKFSYSTLLNWDISFYEIKLGMLYQIKELARVGLTIETPRSYTIKEKYGVQASSFWAGGIEKTIDPSLYKSSVEYEVSTPFKFTGGASFNIYGLILTGQATFMDYSQTRFKNSSGLDETFVSNLNRDIQNSLRAVLNYNFGAEYTIPILDTRIRAGYFTQQSPYKNDPSEYDRKYMTVGMGYLLDGEISLDIAYIFGWWKDFGENYGYNQSRTLQDVKMQNAVFGVSYRF